MKQEFCHLHLHTVYSTLDGMCHLSALFHEAERLGMEAIAITDHQSVSGVVDFYRHALAHEIKPIIGVELNVESFISVGSNYGYHLTVLAKDNLGYTNILKLVSVSNLANGGLVTWRYLEEHKQGLIILSGCMYSELDHLLKLDYAKAREVALEYRNMLGQNNFYLELQRTGLPGEEEMIELKYKLAQELNIPVVATNNVHYLKREDAEAYRVLAFIPRMSFEEIYPIKSRDEYYLKSPKEMAELFKDIPEALENVLIIASRCNVFLDFVRCDFPQFAVPKGYTAESYLRSITYVGLQEYFDFLPPDVYLERVEKELETINHAGYADYFLIVADIVKYAQSQDILISHQGSGCTSLVAYLLGFTSVDPVEYDLNLDYFLNSIHNLSLDIDFEIDHLGRKKIFQYIGCKYGEENVALISTPNILQMSEVIKEIAISLGWPAEKLSRLLLFVSKQNTKDLHSLANNSEFLEIYQTNPVFKKLIDTARKIEGLPRHLNEHQSGIVISRDRLINYTALQYAPDGEIITQFDSSALEALGLLKIDLLATRFLTAICCTLKNLQAQGIKVNLAKIPLDDIRTFRLIQRAETIGCFELESERMRHLLRVIKPMSIREIILVLALYPLEEADQGLVNSFIARLHEVEVIEYPHPLLTNILKETHGHILYQEQVLEIAIELAGFNYTEAEELQKIITEKNHLKIAELKSKFGKQSLGRGLTTAEANYIFDKLYKNASYYSCKAHLAAYARTAYMTAYLQEHYPDAYLAGLLNTHYDIDYHFRKYINLAKHRRIPVLPVDINQSQIFAIVKNGAITLGFLMVKGLGRKAAEEIVQKRADGIYTSLQNFCSRVNMCLIGRSQLVNLIRAGAFDSLGERKEFLKSFV